MVIRGWNVPSSGKLVPCEIKFNHNHIFHIPALSSKSDVIGTASFMDS